MKKIFSIISIVLFFSQTVPFVFATAGACSNHDGVNCAAGPSSDGSVICNDGWSDSTVQYGDEKACTDSVVKLVCPGFVKPVVDWDAFLEYKKTLDAQDQASGSLARMQANNQMLHYNVVQAQRDLEFAQTGFDTEAVKRFAAALANAKQAALKSDLDMQSINIGRLSVLASAIKLFTYCPEAPIQPAISTLQVSVFSDVQFTNPYFDAIKYLKDSNIVQGYSDKSFKPLAPINRAEFTKIIVGVITSTTPSGSNCFNDVHNEWFAPYACYAKDKGIIKGYSDGKFKPNQNINLAEALKIVLLALKVNLSQNTGSNWYDVYLNTASERGILSGMAIDSGHLLNRGEMAQIIYKLKSN